MKAEKAKKSEMVRLYNSSKQMIPLQVRVPGGDFYRSEHQVRLNPGNDVQLPKSHLRVDQIENLQRRGMLKILYDSSEHE
jgi:hypothetical protein